MPPDRLSITTAGKDGAYHLQAKKYAAHGIQLDVQISEGSQENLERLRSTPATSDLALMQGGFGQLGSAIGKRERSRIETLANVNIEAGKVQALAVIGLEPVWIFSSLTVLAAWQTRKVCALQ